MTTSEKSLPVMQQEWLIEATDRIAYSVGAPLSYSIRSSETMMN
jgi:hypothetical protein